MMSIVKKMIPLLLAISVFAAGCGANTPAEEDSATEPPQQAEESEESSEPSEEDITEDEETPSQDTEEMGMKTRVEAVKEQMEALSPDEYDGLEFTAAILERKAILPGGSMNVHVVIKNTGDKTVSFQKGSQKASVPDAVYVYSEDLQTVIPEGNIGPMTMDMQYEVLEPGEEITLVYTLMAFKPNDSFDEYTYEVYSSDEAEYIANLTPEELTERFPDLELVESGNYKGQGVFFYFLPEDGENPTGNPTSYAQVTFDINVQGN